MWIVSNHMQMHTNSKMQMHVSNSSIHRITASNAHPVGNARSKLAYSFQKCPPSFLLGSHFLFFLLYIFPILFILIKTNNWENKFPEFIRIKSKYFLSRNLIKKRKKKIDLWPKIKMILKSSCPFAFVHQIP